MSRWRVLSQVVLVAVQVARVMSSYCEARLWQFCHVVVPWGGACPVMDGRYLVLELVNISFSPLPALANFFYLKSVLVQINLGTPLLLLWSNGGASNANRPTFGTFVRRHAGTRFVPSQTQTVCSYVVWNAVPTHTLCSI